MKLPPFGKALAERQRFKNPPLYACVCIGVDAWQRAKRWNAPPGGACAMVLPADAAPNAFEWPVENIPVVIDADTGPGMELINSLAYRLLVCGAVAVTLVSFTDSHPFTRFLWSQQ